MAIEKFRFVSPGVQFNEIDDSIITPLPPAIGPVVIGRTAKGPAMQPVVVSSVGELEKIFGSPSNGVVGAVDVWRTETPTAPTLGTYAARAFLRNSGPVTVIRLAGVDLPSAAETTDESRPGWKANKAYGLFAVSGTAATLASVFYTQTATAVEVSSSSGWATAASASLVSNSFNLRISGSSGIIASSNVSLVPTNTNFLRNNFNTNPTKYSSETYFLGESLENSLNTFTDVFVAELSSSHASFQENPTSAQSPYITSDHANGSDPIDLFRFEGLNSGASLSKEIKISIENVRASKNTSVTKYGTFDVVVRKLFEPTNSQLVLERFTGVNLDPTSDNYILKRIGDSYRKWNVETGRYVEYGSYPNRSAYIRVELSLQDIPATALPHGFRIKVPQVSCGSLAGNGLTGSYPTIEILTDEKDASTARTTRFGLVSSPINNADLVDLIRHKSSVGYTSNQLFTTRYVNTGSAVSSSLYVDGTYNSTDFLASGRILGFDVPLYGGFDGANITLAEPFVNNDPNVLGANDSELDSAAYRAIKAAIDLAASPELLDMNVLCIPGLQHKTLTSYMVDVCKSRGDAIAIIDLEGDYKYAYENGGTDNRDSMTVSNVISSLEARTIDNSYGATYFPAVFVQSEGIFLPSSIAALGAFGGSEGRSALWFAPAGFNRGGLTEGNAGIGVSRTALNLTRTDRDDLYAANINPIATFPNEGIVIFGQKTLQTTPSALDRVNVRRLVNFIKKQISRAATRVLFEPNVENTWNNFKGVVNPFLQAIKNAYGLDDARVILDSSTTTADLVDRNIMYAKILIKPTRAIEFIAIDFVVTNSGASFTE